MSGKIEPLTFQQMMNLNGWSGPVFPDMQPVFDNFKNHYGDKNPNISVVKPAYLESQEAEARHAVLVYKGDPSATVQSDDCWIIQHDLILPWCVQTRREASNSGEKRYWNGETCKYNHVSQRYTASGACCECQKLANTKPGKNLDEVIFKAVVHKDDLAMLESTARGLKANRFRLEAEKLENGG